MIFTFFRTCRCYSEAFNTGTQKWSSIVQYSCTSIWDLKYTLSVYFKSQILVHEYWTILDHFGVPVLFASGCHQHVLKNVNITFPDNAGTHKMFQYLPILGHSSVWDLKYTFPISEFSQIPPRLLALYKKHGINL